MTERDVALKAAAGQAPWPLLHCTRCLSTMAASYEQDFKYPWSIKLKCGSCQGSWWVCRYCPDQRSHFQTSSQASRHNRSKHKKETESQATQPAATRQASSQIAFHYIKRSASREYFRAAAQGKGINYVITKALGQHNSCANLDNQDVDMMMTLSRFVATLTRPQRENLGQVLNKTTDATLRHSELLRSRHRQDTFVVPVPMSKQRIRSIICDGRNAVMPNLPHPDVHELGDHAYLLPSECVADFMAHGLATQSRASSTHPVQSLGRSPLAKVISDKNDQWSVTTIFLSLWSDDFEPNYSKGNRGSVWLFTMTMQTKTTSAVAFEHVYPIAVGPKASNHGPVTRVIIDDMKSLERPSGQDSVTAMCNGATGQEEKVSAHLICVVQDQPERRGFNGLLSGGKGHHARWGHSLNSQKVLDRLPPCRTCLNRTKTSIIQGFYAPSTCADCFNFWESKEEMATTPDEDYPEEEMDLDPNLDGTVQHNTRCVALAHGLLKSVVKKVHEHLSKSEPDWGLSEARACMSRFCLNIRSQEEILECASNCSLREQAMLDPENNAAAVTASNELRASQPEKHQLWSHPPIWDASLTLPQFAEPCMHLLFLGIMKNTVFEIQDWAALRNKYSSMRRTMLISCASLERLHLSWCKVQPCKGEKLGGWVSENFLGFARVIPWVCSCLLSLEDDSPFVIPDKPIGKWTVEECKGFLRERRLAIGGKVAELRNRVRDNVKAPIPPPAGGPVGNVTSMLLSLWQMLADLMGMETAQDQRLTITECLIRLCLSTLEAHDKSIREATGRSAPIWQTQHNCQCLLNIPEQVKLLGPVRNRWEGGRRGEGFLRSAKPVVRASCKNWQRNLLQDTLRQKTLVHLTPSSQADEASNDDDSLASSESSESQEPQIHQPQSFRMYGNQAEILRDMGRGLPLSGLLVGKTFYCCFVSGPKKLLQEIAYLPNTGRYRFGLWYFKMDYVLSDSDDLPLLHDTHADRYAVLLPFDDGNLDDDDDADGQWWAMVASDWKCWNVACEIVAPATYLHSDVTLKPE